MDLFMDLQCQGSCASADDTECPWYEPAGFGDQVRWNPIAGLSLCAYCQDRWSNWYAGIGTKPRWLKDD